MPETKLYSVKDLVLDLRNYRTVPQPDEIHAVQAMISISPDYFFALMESLVDDGYLPTENVIVIKDGSVEPKMIVREGNRRVAALKLIYGYLPISSINIPEYLKDKIDSISDEWKEMNKIVPCAIYENADGITVDKIVTLAHGKGEKAGRDQWNPVARARHNRDVKRSNEPALDLLEKYIKIGRNLTPQQSERWTGIFPLSVLDEAIKRTSIRFDTNSAPELAKKYPSIKYKDILDEIIKSIGQKMIGFDAIRDTDNDFAAQFGLPVISKQNAHSSSNGKDSSTSDSQTSANTHGQSGSTKSNDGQNDTSVNSTSSQSPNESGNHSQSSQSTTEGNTQGVTSKKAPAYPIDDPRSVTKLLKVLKPVGSNRQKVVTLRNEALKLKLKDNPIAFCFLIRSMFEISAKAYCADYASAAGGGLSATKADGMDRNLIDVLRDITTHMTTLPDGKKNQPMLKVLHGALTELAKSDSVLSVTSMNQLVHSPTYTVNTGDVCVMFGNIFPLLHEMNK